MRIVDSHMYFVLITVIYADKLLFTIRLYVPPNNCVASVYKALTVMLKFMSMQQAPTKKPTLCATIVFSRRNASIITNRLALLKPSIG